MNRRGMSESAGCLDVAGCTGVRVDAVIAPANRPAKKIRHQRMESERHRAVIDQLVAAGCVEGGFSRATQEAVGATFDDAPIMTPDAYGLAHSGREVHIYEVEASHPIDRHKAAKIAAWAAWLSAQGWTLRLTKCDTHGGMLECDPYTLRMTAAEFEKVRQIMSTIPGFSSPLPKDPT